MKKFIIGIMIIGMVVNTYAQKRSGLGIHAGIIGTGVYDIELGINPNYDSGAGFTFGAGYNLKLGPIGVSAELNFVNKKVNNFRYPAYSWNDDDTEVLSWNLNNVNVWNFEGVTEWSYNYMAIPIVGKLYLGPINFQLGFQTSFLLGGYKQAEGYKDYTINGDDTPYPDGKVPFSAEEIYTYDDGTSDTYKPHYTDGIISDVDNEFFDFNNMDIAIVMGIGLELKMGLYASARSTASITPLMNMDIIDDQNQYAINEGYGDEDYYNEIIDGSYLKSVPHNQTIRLLNRLFTSEITIGYRF